MTQNVITNLCKEKEQELLDRYFGNLVHEAAIDKPETISEYTKELPLKIEAEYRAFLEELWKQHAPSELQGLPLVLEEQKLRKLMTDDDREGIDAAYKEASTITLWEKITKSNHEDVTYYKGLPLEYTKKYNEQEQLHFTTYRYEGCGAAGRVKCFSRGNREECA